MNYGIRNKLCEEENIHQVDYENIEKNENTDVLNKSIPSH